MGIISLEKIKKLYLSLPTKHQILLIPFSIALLLLMITTMFTSEDTEQLPEIKIGQRYALAIPDDDTKKSQTSSQLDLFDDKKPLTITASTETPPLTKKKAEQSEKTNEIKWQTVKVKRGDSLAKIFKRHGLGATTTHKVITAKGKNSKLLKRLNVGDKLRIGKNTSGELVALEYPFSKTETLFVNQQANKQYKSHKEAKQVDVRQTAAIGTITSNFWNAAASAGLNDAQIINLANIFGWDIDFALDIRKGDSFNVIYESQYVDGEFIGTGQILAAEFINQNEMFQAIRFTDGEYYSPDGKSMRKAFLRAPVNFKYISSNFKRRRFHPVQKRWKAHRGTDYAAKTGTPVVAAGNGKVIKSSYNRFNGHYVFIQHGNGIVTKYLHFSKRKVKQGQRVKQGQVIGYVGATGLAAGPHLHYEFLLNGVHRNPRTVKLPDAKPISNKYKKAFSLIAQQRLSELSGSRVALSSNRDKDTHAE